jgi:hypothetical protein
MSNLFESIGSFLIVLLQVSDHANLIKGEGIERADARGVPKKLLSDCEVSSFCILHADAECG